MNPHEIAGLRALGVLSNLKGLPDNHYEVHRLATEALNDDGFATLKYVDVIYWGGKRKGRLDLLAARDGGLVAIEFNNRSVKPISPPKLRCVDTFRIIASRGVKIAVKPTGIHAMVALDVAR